MTSPALEKLLGPKPTEPQPMEWIKVRRHAPYVRLVVPACAVCGDSAGEVTWYHAKTGRARCMRCFGRVPKPERLDAEARRRLKWTYKRKDTPARRKRYRPKKRKGKS